MADITAANIGTFTRTALSNKFLVYSQIAGDGTGVTVNVPLGKVEAAWIQAGGSSGVTAESSMPTITWATNIITYSAAPSNNKTHLLVCIGTD